MTTPFNSLYLVALIAVVALVWLLQKKDKPDSVPDNIMTADAWEIGPIIGSENLSSGLSIHPAAVAAGMAIDIPYPPPPEAGSVHYVTVPTASLTGKTKVTLVCELVMAEGVKLCPVKSPASPSLLTLYFQRKGDNWTGTGEFETYRWFASFATQTDLTAKEYTIEARFDDNWTAIQTSSRATQPEAFAAALANAGRIGFVLGGGDGLGHGVFATGPAKLTVKLFKVE